MKLPTPILLMDLPIDGSLPVRSLGESMAQARSGMTLQELSARSEIPVERLIAFEADEERPSAMEMLRIAEIEAEHSQDDPFLLKLAKLTGELRALPRAELVRAVDLICAEADVELAVVRYLEQVEGKEHDR